jgi:hypothetical protein
MLMFSLWNAAHCKAILAVSLFVTVASSTLGETVPDTTNLAVHLQAVRGKKTLDAAEYRSLQTEYMEWIDARVKAGVSIEKMNAELREASLFYHWVDSADEIADEYSRSRAGYLEPISTRPLRGAAELLAIKAAIYKGIGCDLDMAVALYERDSLKRVGLLRADQEDSALSYHLSGLDGVQRGAAGEWLAASSWTASNCSSAWNGKRVRIDVLRGAEVKNLTAKDLYARDRDRVEDVAVWVRRNLVTFWYEGGLRNTDLLSVPGVLRYQVTDDVAKREGPVALTRAGFLQEWLNMDDAEAAGWSGPDAAGKHATISTAFAHGAFSWDRIARCDGSPQVWEIGVRLAEAKTRYTFLISGSRATELRMRSIGDDPSESCTPLDVRKNLSGLSAELPW